ncbi:glycosyltransferase family 2 protein [Clostridium tarantellae]|uniref:Glycosyltransferase n=1 Tax=Clostridium tarantellae TaxID=39493 RepID=A0A6I1MHH5_9CLOT|nr:glycosyltransferase family 2 protein [Clostridium tarantellae]MPQ42304.1 glycosyltransferase [Clostridium tarantellae]
MYEYEVTVFTPTYNRGYIIEKLYKSLKNQSDKRFEWIVIDDGSEDCTKDLFEKWIKEKNEFTINYQNIINGGKHRAINKGVELAKGKLFFIVDSDDYLTNDAISNLIKVEKTLNGTNEKFAGIAALRGFNEKKIIGTTFKGYTIDATSLEREKYNINGDKAEAFYTHILKKYKFPEFNGEKFLTENVVWNEIAFDGYKLRWFNEIIYICNYLEDGLTSNVKNLFINNPKGYAYMIKQNIKHNKKRFQFRVYAYLNYFLQMENKISLEKMAINLEINKFFLIVIIELWRLKRKIKGENYEG